MKLCRPVDMVVQSFMLNMWLMQGTKCKVHLFSNDDGTGSHREAIDLSVAEGHCNEIEQHSAKR